MNLAPVLKHINAKAHKAPGHEKYKTAIFCCGGGTAGVLMAGAIQALFDKALMPGIDEFNGASVGTWNIVGAALGQETFNLFSKIYFKEAVDRRHYSFWRFGSVSNIKWIIENKLKKILDPNLVRTQGRDIFVSLADAQYNLHFENLRTTEYDIFDVLHAATSMQGLGNGLIRVGSHQWWDGATLDQLPLAKLPHLQELTDILVLPRWLPPGDKFYHGQSSPKQLLLLGMILQLRHYKQNPLTTMAKLYHHQDGWSKGLEFAQQCHKPRIAFLWPSPTLDVPLLTHDSNLLKIAFDNTRDKVGRDIEFILNRI